MSDAPTAYPLQWPIGVLRTPAAIQLGWPRSTPRRMRRWERLGMDDAPITLAEMVEEADVMVTEIWCNCERAERLGLPPNAYIKRRIAVMAEIARYLRGQQGD